MSQPPSGSGRDGAGGFFRSRWVRILIAPAALLVAVVVIWSLFLTGHLGTGRGQPTPTPTSIAETTPTAEPPTSAPALTPGASPSPSPQIVNQLSVPSLGITVPLVYEDCKEFSSAHMPPSGSALLAVCTPATFYGVVAPQDGPLGPLASTATAPAGTQILIWRQLGIERRWTLDSSVNTFEAFSDGSFPGHGAVLGGLYVQIRGGGRALQRFGPP
jgi:hypothetical protein